MMGREGSITRKTRETDIHAELALDGSGTAEVSTGSTEIAKNIGGVAQAAESTTSGASDSQKAARELARTSSELQTLVGKFKIGQNGE